jgi:cytochrome c-type biogenesis protein CcmE|tara:strand:+ start:219 stop:644 length:426 start_codon:yes stop_codon:yes gene_type:complete
MLTRKVRSRIFLFFLSIVLLGLIIFFIFKSLEDNLVYFFSPTEINNKINISYHEKIRVGGLVKENSITKKETSINFIITDLKNEIFVTYSGPIPNLFSEGKGVIAEGKLKDKKFFVADKILAKHDENYMPPEVAKVLEKSE